VFVTTSLLWPSVMFVGKGEHALIVKSHNQETDGHTNRQTDKEVYRVIDIHTDRLRGVQIYIQTHRQTKRCTDL
jgi:hypothetical protein